MFRLDLDFEGTMKKLYAKEIESAQANTSDDTEPVTPVAASTPRDAKSPNMQLQMALSSSPPDQQLFRDTPKFIARRTSKRKKSLLT